MALAYLAGKLAYRIRDVLLMLAVAGFISADPESSGGGAAAVAESGAAAGRWRWWPSWAVLVFAGLLSGVRLPAGARGEPTCRRQLPAYVRDAEHGFTAGLAIWSRRFHLTAWATRNAPKLRSVAASLARPALNVGRGAISLLLTLATVAALVVLLLLEGPRMREGLLGLMSPAPGRPLYPGSG